MKHLRYLFLAALVAMPLTACDEDDDPVIDPIVYGTITGTVAAEGTGLSGVNVTLVGQASQSATTGAGGTFTFTNVEAGSYGIAIDASSHADVSFSQTSKTATVATQGETVTVDFAGSYIRTSTITGVVSASGAPLGGIAVDVTGGPDNVTNSSVTNAGGEFFATGLRAGTYTVTVTPPAGVTFATTSASVTVGTGETKTAQFPGEAVQLAAISGAVTVDGDPVVGVVVTLSGGADATTETGANGAYSFVNLTPGEYTVTITAPAETTFDDGVAKTLTVGAGETGVASFAGKGPIEPSTISIGSLTAGGAPINLANVFGQIEVALNIGRGDLDLDRVEVVINDEIVASQTFANAVGAEAAPGDEEVVILNVPTTQVRMVGDAYVPVLFNGGSFISANLYEVGATAPIPSNEVAFVLNNPDAVMIPAPSFTPDMMTPMVTVGTADWYTGDATFTGTLYIAYSSIAPTGVAWGDAGTAGCAVTSTIAGTATTGLAITNMYDCDGVEGTVVPNAAAAPAFTPAVAPPGPDGSTVVYPTTGFASLGAEFMLDDDARWYLIPTGFLPNPLTLNLDNLGPTVWVDGDGTDVGTLVAFMDDFDQPWVNATHTFVMFDVDGLVDPAGDVMAADFGVGLDDATTVALDMDWMGTPADASDDVCTDMVKVTGDDYDETQASDGTPDGWMICGQAADLLGNTAKSAGSSNFFGVDKEAPFIRAYDEDGAGGADISPDLDTEVEGMVFSSVGADGSYDATWMWAFEALDGRSGFDTNYANADYPAMQSLEHFSSTTNALACTGFDNTLNPIVGDQYVRTVVVDFTCLGDLVEPGYFVYDNMVTDRAGNMATLGMATYAVDDILGGAATSLAPTFDLLGFATTFYTPGQPADFNVWATDDLEVIEAELSLVHPTVLGDFTVNYGFGAIDAFMRFDGIDPYDATLFSAAAIGQTVSTPRPVFGRLDLICSGAGAPYAGCVDVHEVTPVAAEYNNGGVDADFLPTEAGGMVQDVGYNQTALAANITFIPAQWDGATAAPWSAIAPGTVSDLIIRAFYITEINADVDFEAVMEAPTSIEVTFFDSVELVHANLGVLTFCGAFSYDDDTDNGVDRFFNYSASIAAGTPCDGIGAGTWHAVGVKGDAALISGGV